MPLRPHPVIQPETLQLSAAKAEEKGSPEKKNALVLKRPSGKDMRITAITFLQTKQVMWPNLISKGQISINVFSKGALNMSKELYTLLFTPYTRVTVHLILNHNP